MAGSDTPPMPAAGAQVDMHESGLELWKIAGGATALAALILIIAASMWNNSSRPGGGASNLAQQAAPAADTAVARMRDSVEAMALAGDTVPAGPELLRLEYITHRRRFAIPHAAAHAAYVDVMLDSVTERMNRDVDVSGARHDLSFIDGPFTPNQEARRRALQRRVGATEARSAARASADLAERRIQAIRAQQVGDCTPPLRAVRNRVAKNPEWSDDIIAVTACGKVRLGMTREQAIAGWGRPQDINRTTFSFGVHEQWVYGEYGERGFLYFEDGILTSTQN